MSAHRTNSPTLFLAHSLHGVMSFFREKSIHNIANLLLVTLFFSPIPTTDAARGDPSLISRVRKIEQKHSSGWARKKNGDPGATPAHHRFFCLFHKKKVCQRRRANKRQPKAKSPSDWEETACPKTAL